jgi:BolA protein
VSARFAGLGTVQRHRLVYDAAGNLMRNGIHALSVTAKTPEEFKPQP